MPYVILRLPLAPALALGSAWCVGGCSLYPAPVAGLCSATGILAWRCGQDKREGLGRVLGAQPALELSEGDGGGVSPPVGSSENVPQFGF